MTSSTSGLDNKTENNQRQLHWLLHYFSLFFNVSHDKAPCPEPSTLACCEKEAFVSVSSRKTSSTFSFPPSQTGGENLPLCPGLHRRAIRHGQHRSPQGQREWVKVWIQPEWANQPLLWAESLRKSMYSAGSWSHLRGCDSAASNPTVLLPLLDI